MIHLKNHPLLCRIDPVHLDELRHRSQKVTLKKGDILFHQEEVAHFIYVVTSRTLKILKISSMGQEKIFSLYQNNQWIALGTLFNPPHLYPATAVAVELTEVIKVPRQVLEVGILSTEAATKEWFQQLNRRLEGVQQMFTDQVFTDAKDRFKKWLQRFVTVKKEFTEEVVFITLPVTKQEVADLLSIRRETFSRLLAELKEEGVCEVKGKTFKVNRKWLET